MSNTFWYRAQDAENWLLEVPTNHICVEPWILPEGPLWDDDGGECFAPYEKEEVQGCPEDIFRNIVRQHKEIRDCGQVPEYGVFMVSMNW